MKKFYISFYCMQKDKKIAQFTQSLKYYLRDNMKNRVFTSPSLLSRQNYTVYKGLTPTTNKNSPQIIKYESKKRKFHSKQQNEQKIFGKLMIPISSLLNQRNANFKHQLKMQRQQNFGLSSTMSATQKYKEYLKKFEGLEKMLQSECKKNRLKTSQATEYKWQQPNSNYTTKLQIVQKPNLEIDKETWKKIERQSKRVRNQTEIVLRMVKKKQPQQVEKALQKIKKHNDKFFRPKYLRAQKSSQQKQFSLKKININNLSQNDSRDHSQACNEGVLMKIMKANFSDKKIQCLEKSNLKAEASIRKKQKNQKITYRRKSQYARRSQILDLQISGWNDRNLQDLQNY